MIEFLLSLAVIWLIIASFQDIKKTEIPNWLSFSLILFALAYRAVYSAVNSDSSFFLYGLFGFAVFFVLANLFYYARVFAGGDAKLLMALGPVLPLAPSFYYNLILLGIFVLFVLAVGGVYGLVYSVFVMMLNRKKFVYEFSEQMKKKKQLIFFSLIPTFLSFVVVFYSGESIFFLFPLLIIAFPFLFIYAKAIEECMVKTMSGEKITVGDWLYKEVKVKGRTIKPNWEGLDEKEVKLLRKIRKIEIKQGIPFAPVFLISFILLLILWYSSWSFFQLF